MVWVTMKIYYFVFLQFFTKFKQFKIKSNENLRRK